MTEHLAILGIAHIADGKPLYYDAINEAGLAVAGLNFGESAIYLPRREGFHNVASFELIPWILGQCRDLKEAVVLLESTNLTGDSFSSSLPGFTATSRRPRL